MIPKSGFPINPGFLSPKLQHRGPLQPLPRWFPRMKGPMRRRAWRPPGQGGSNQKVKSKTESFLKMRLLLLVPHLCFFLFLLLLLLLLFLLSFFSFSDCLRCCSSCCSWCCGVGVVVAVVVIISNKKDENYYALSSYFQINPWSLCKKNTYHWVMFQIIHHPSLPFKESRPPRDPPKSDHPSEKVPLHDSLEQVKEE